MTTKPTAAIYIYEKDQGGIPAAVSAALSKLNATGLRATTFEEDTVDGSGSVPEQYRVPLEAAQKAGLPALVVGPFPTKGEAARYADLATDKVCPAGEKWEVWKARAPKF